MVGIVSSSKVPSVMALTSVVFPAFCNPTIAISSYLLKNLLLTQSSILLINPSILTITIIMNCNLQLTFATVQLNGYQLTFIHICFFSISISAYLFPPFSLFWAPICYHKYPFFQFFGQLTHQISNNYVFLMLSVSLCLVKIVYVQGFRRLAFWLSFIVLKIFI